MENKKARLIIQFIKFGITGGLGTITNLLIFFVLVDLSGFPEIPVSILCFIIAGTQNYLLHHLWSFREYTANTKASLKKWFIFLAGSLIGLVINISVMYTIILFFLLPFKFIAQAFGIAAGMIINFIISKLFIFKRTENA
ncbi:MAG: GtrA family protein [Treponema sp.]|nr:GtrA family protein [Treponema sp.]